MTNKWQTSFNMNTDWVDQQHISKDKRRVCVMVLSQENDRDRWKSVCCAWLLLGPPFAASVSAVTSLNTSLCSSTLPAEVVHVNVYVPSALTWIRSNGEIECKDTINWRWNMGSTHQCNKLGRVLVLALNSDSLTSFCFGIALDLGDWNKVLLGEMGLFPQINDSYSF